MALALRRLGKDARVVSRDHVPQMQVFPGVESIEVVESIDDPGDAVIILEVAMHSGRESRASERGYVINIDHHLRQRDVRRDELAGPVGRGVRRNGLRADRRAGSLADTGDRDTSIPRSSRDTGAFHYSNITPRTFDICR